MFGTKNVVVSVALALAVTGCSGGFNLPGSQEDQIVAFAGVTAVGCGFIPAKDKPAAKSAVECAKAAFSETVSPEQVSACAAAAGVPAQYQVLVGLVVEQVKKLTGGGILDPTSQEAKAVTEFLRVCDLALGKV